MVSQVPGTELDEDWGLELNSLAEPELGDPSEPLGITQSMVHSSDSNQSGPEAHTRDSSEQNSKPMTYSPDTLRWANPEVPL